MTDFGFPLVEVCGSSYEMGYQHGAQVAGLVRRYIGWIEQADWPAADVLSRNALAFLPILQAFSPAFVEEVRGLADGAGISFEQALLCQVRGEAARVAGSNPPGLMRGVRPSHSPDPRRLTGSHWRGRTRIWSRSSRISVFCCG